MPDPVILTVRRTIAAPPERLFDAWLDPADAARFLFRTPDGEMIRCDIDPRVGGHATIVERRPAGDARHRLRYEVIDPPRRLVFLFAADPAPEGAWTRVTIDIAPAPGGAALTLTHEMDPQWADYADRTRAGWATILNNLAHVTEEPNG